MPRILVIDPGVRHLGWVVAEGPENLDVVDAGAHTLPDDMGATAHLHDVAHWYATRPELAPWLTPGVVDEVVVERMVVYPRGGGGDPNDLLNIQAVGALLAGRTGAPVVWARPSEWKGQVPKDVNHAATLAFLHRKGLMIGYERALSRFRKRDHEHAHDATGILLFHLNALGPSVNMAAWQRNLTRSSTPLPSMRQAKSLASATPGRTAPRPSRMPSWAKTKP